MDDFQGHAPTLEGPVDGGAEVTPGASPLPRTSRALYVGGEGDVRVTLARGDTVTLQGVPGGAILPVRATHVLASGTTAGGIVALY